ncbi:hypothetical protein B0A67_01310 [Flavobacterium aquidurense]|uniref:hypothetical protein n=1 Tax=Flavobacterium aquidurense TaxID=362413 RepID=UPI00091DFA6A|nr:hypothetical protein [Flavobacterium aquidurense]OXA74017.1 hypothetical protein B0A67_01310 [Flavobacterium aquidurense]SHG57939.1 hypothetical protein SAMN05444481_105196 [Flavobacterium frigidimaris]
MKLTIPNLVFILLIGITTICLTFLTTKGQFTDNRYNRLWDKLTKRGKTVFFTLIFMLFLLITQEWNNQNLNSNNQNLIDSIQFKRNDDITRGIKKGVDSSNKKLFENLSIALANQNLKFDTLNKSFIKFKNLKETINNFAIDDPVIFIDSNGISFNKRRGFSNNYKVKFISQNAGSTQHNIISYCLIHFQDGSYNIDKANLFAKDLHIPKNAVWITGINVDAYKPITTIYLLLKGTYSTIDKSKKYEIEDLYAYDVEAQKVSIPIADRGRIISIINELSSQKK